MVKKSSFFAVLLVIIVLFSNSVSAFAAPKSSRLTAPTFSIAPAALTNGDVTVTIYYPSDAAVRQYKLGSGGTWLNYTGPFTVTSNVYVYAQYENISGKWSPTGGYNIDKTPPAAPVFTSSNTASTTQPVTVSITYSVDSAVKQYKIGDAGTWTSYTAPIVLSSNNTICAQASDAAGNWTSIVSYTVSNIVTNASSKKLVLGYTVNSSAYSVMTANVGALSEIATATWGIDGLGNFSGAAPTDQISFANSNGMGSNLVVSNNFDSTIAKTLLENTTNRTNLENNILNILKTYNYSGVNIDIENIPSTDRTYFTAFMSEVYNKLKPLGYEVTVAVPAKTYDSSTATWNYAFDYKSLANYADYLMIMAYDEHYPGGTPGAIASIGWVTNVVNYALTVVPKEKIVLGLAAYGYDWSSNGTKAYSLNACINLAAAYGAAIQFDSTTKSKYFTYTDSSGVSHTVWFEDADTISYKLDIVNSSNLRGIGIWRLGLDNTDYWNMIRSKFGI